MRIARVAMSLVLGTATVILSPAAAGSRQVADLCDYVSTCSERKRVYPIPASVTHHTCDRNGQAPTGAVDETADLQAWIDSVPDGAWRPVPGDTTGHPQLDNWYVLEFPNGRCIRLDGHLTIQDRHNLIFDGGGVTLDQHLKPATAGATPSGGKWNGSGAWHVIKGSFLQWRSFKIVGNHIHSEKQTEWNGRNASRQTKVATFGACHVHTPGPPSNRFCEWQYAWNIRGSQHVTLEGNESRDTHGDSIAIEWGPGINVMPRDIAINNHAVYRTGRQGISVISGEDITISNSYIEGAASNAIDLEPERWEDDRFPIRRISITRNRFGESHAAILVANGKCAEISDINFTHNEQVEPNISNRPAIEMIAPTLSPRGLSCSRQRGPVTINNNIFRIRETGIESDVAADIVRYSNVTFNSNSIMHICHAATPHCTADQPPISLHAGSGHVVNRNDLAAGNLSHQWQWVYSYNGARHASLGVNVSSCGSRTARGGDQPSPCSRPLP